MPAVLTLSQFQTDHDFVASFRNDGPWSVPAAGPAGLLNALLVFLVERRAAYPVIVGDGAFVGLHDAHRLVGAAHARSEADTRSALLALEAERLVESVGRRTGTARWRATDHGALTVRASR